jgi:HK97 family phage major capsid protein
MNRLKELQEKRGAKLKAAHEIITLAETEKRELTGEEVTKVNGFHKEAEAVIESIVAETRQLALAGSKPVELSAQEKRDVGSFDFAKLVRHLHRSAKGQLSKIDGIEAEMIEEGENEARSAGIQTGGLMLPRMLVRRGGHGAEHRDMTATGTTSVTGDQGGMTIATGKAGILDDFYNASVLRAAGATVLEGLIGNLDVPRLVAGTPGAGKAENAAADETSPTTLMLSLSPKRLPAFVDISERLLMQSSSAIEAVVRSCLINQALATQEAAFFHGGGTNQANGIAATSGIGSVVGGTHGLAPSLLHIVNLETAVDTSNALLGNLHYFSNGQVRGKLKQTPKVASTDSRMLLDDSGLLNGYQPLFTNAISRTLTKGDSAGVCSAIFFGNAADYWIGYWGGISLEMVRDKTNATTGLYTLVASAYYDGGVVRPKSFAAMLDALAA